MDTREIDAMLAATLADLRLSRGERSALEQRLAELAESPAHLDQVRARAFAAAHERLPDGSARELLGWLEEVVKVLARRRESTHEMLCEVRFAPGESCIRRLTELLATARGAVDVCVFTVTDNRISREVLACHERGVKVRLITDNAKSWDPGSDVMAFDRAGIPVVIDEGPAHMHHKFAVFDRRVVATGSFNWTRSATDENHENLLICDHPPMVGRYLEEFERLWSALRRL
jgi:phosphatidylserine/phosphatidylglycerophosphate/cardiolipin synthase-like enzyme